MLSFLSNASWVLFLEYTLPTVLNCLLEGCKLTREGSASWDYTNTIPGAQTFCLSSMIVGGRASHGHCLGLFLGGCSLWEE